MSNSWHQKYTELTNFVAEHPQVEVGVSRVIIPESVRPEFYRLFNNVRTAFVEEKLPDLLNEARPLSEEYTKVEAEVIKLLELEKISLATSLHRFLHNPMDELVRELFDPLFDLLKRKVDIETLEERALSNIEFAFKDLHHLGYEKWVALSLVKLFEADKLFQVIIRRPSDTAKVIIESEQRREEVPPPKESKRLSFDHTQKALFTIPDFIIHLTKVDRYIALRSQLSRAIAIASDTSEARKWYHLDSIGAFTSGLTLVYVADDLSEISLIADAEKICRPDLIIKCEGNKDWYGEERMEKTKLQHNALKPLMGTYIVSRETVPGQAYKNLMPEESVAPILGEEKPEQGDAGQASIHILAVGFDQSKLESIINILIGSRR